MKLDSGLRRNDEIKRTKQEKQTMKLDSGLRRNVEAGKIPPHPKKGYIVLRVPSGSTLAAGGR